MKRFLLIFILSTSSLFGLRNFQRFYIGAENIGIGNAAVADSSAESTIVYNPSIIPALYSTNSSFIISYEVFSTFKIIDILALNIKYDFDIFPFFSFILPKENYGLSLSLEDLFYSPEASFDLRFVKLSLSYKPLENFVIGFSPGFLIATENNGYGFGYGGQFSFLLKILENLEMGGSFLYFSQVEWDITPYGDKLIEKFPNEINFGGTLKMNKDLFFYFSIANSFLNEVSFTIDGTKTTPEWATNFIYLKPSIGVRFLEKNTGGHIAIGCFIDHYFTETSILNQYYLTFGFRGYGKRLKYNISFTDGYLINLFYRENIPRESINISFSFYF
ncbi:MAG: hypothetical protein ACP5Q5_01030 [Brevinematia bacterium]